MSPEQFTGKSLDARSDIYSLAVMAYEMLTGRLPFEAETPWQWATEHKTAKPIPFEATPVSSQIPASMRAAILRALSKNKEDRQSSASQFVDELAGNAGAPAPGASTGTAAMAAPPVFGGPMNPAAKTAAMPAPSTGPAVASAVIPTPSTPRGGGGGNKGLVFGLAGVGAVILVGIVVVATRSKNEPVAAAPPLDTPTAAPAKIAPQIDTTTPATPDTVPVPEQTPTPVAPVGTKPTTKPTPATTTPATTTTPPATTTTPATKPPVESGGGNACAACISAASAGNFGSAAASYNACSDPGQKASCGGIIKGRAPAAAQAAAFNGNCGQAHTIASAGQAAGLPAKAFAAALKACK
jgi:serine/threonine-protein kinase